MGIQCRNKNVGLHKTFNPWMNSLRYALFVMNVLFTIIAGFLIVSGCKLIVEYNNFYLFVSLFYRLPAHLILAVGIILIFTTCFGWFGTIKLHPLSLKLYSALLFALAFVSIAISITSFVALNAVEEDIDLKMFEAAKKFEVDENVRRTWNYVQEEYSCCGVNFPENWYGIKSNGLNGGPLLQYRGFTRRYPYSCCVHESCKEGTIYENGCASYIIDYVSKAILLSACSSVVLVTIQTIAAITAYLFGNRLQKCLNLQRVYNHMGKHSIVLASPNSIAKV